MMNPEARPSARPLLPPPAPPPQAEFEPAEFERLQRDYERMRRNFRQHVDSLRRIENMELQLVAQERVFYFVSGAVVMAAAWLLTCVFG